MPAQFLSPPAQAAYAQTYQHALENPDQFWDQQGQCLDWIRPYRRVRDGSFSESATMRWYLDGVLNVSANCVDRHAAKQPDKVALIWEGENPDSPSIRMSYKTLLEETCRMAHILKALGVSRGARVVIYMPMIPQAVVAMLACARIGAIHSVVFGGFSSAALAERIQNCGARHLITADRGRRGNQVIPLLANAREAQARCPDLSSILVIGLDGENGKRPVKRPVKHPGAASDTEACYWTMRESASTHYPPEPMDSEAPLFILYTSGSTGKPKGLVHSSGGYLVYASQTFESLFDYRSDDIHWCTADIGWITGHSYVVYGPLAQGATVLLYEGVPHYPDWSRCWNICDKHKVSLFYTAPTLVRSMMQAGDSFVQRTSRESLRILGTVGEPINPKAWNWYADVVGKGRLPVLDTWWQTETGGIMLAPHFRAHPQKPGSVNRPFYGIQPVLLDESGKPAEAGQLCFRESWPGQARTIYGDHERFVETYFKKFPGYYASGDGAQRDEDGDYWLTGRMDDVLNVSGHRIGTAEIESALVAHPAVAEAAVVGCPHPVKGEALYAFVTLKAGVEIAKPDLRAWVAHQIGSFAKPDYLQWAPVLPKTRSGKIMRRILKKIVAGETASDLGDISTLANPEVVSDLAAQACKVSRPA